LCHNGHIAQTQRRVTGFTECMREKTLRGGKDGGREEGSAWNSEGVGICYEGEEQKERMKYVYKKRVYPKRLV